MSGERADGLIIQKLPTRGEISGAMPVTQESEVSDFQEAIGQDVEEERRMNSWASSVMCRLWWPRR